MGNDDNVRDKRDGITVPLNVALSQSTRYSLSVMLNSKKVLSTKEGLRRDWRGVAELAGCSNDEILNWNRQEDPLDYVLRRSHVTWSNLNQILERLDRYDVLDDLSGVIEKDVSRFENSRPDNELAQEDGGLKPLAIGDQERLSSGLEPKKYDAFLMYDDQDWKFSETVRSKLEEEFHLKLCLKDRDVIYGINVMSVLEEVIEKRCRHAIIIFSEALLESTFYSRDYILYLVAHPTQNVNVIPIVYKEIPDQKFPLALRMVHFWDARKDTSTWEQLAKTISMNRGPADTSTSSKDKLSSTSKDKLFSTSKDKLSSNSKDKLSSNSKDKLSSNSKDKVSSNSKDKVSNSSTDRLSSSLKDRQSTSSKDLKMKEQFLKPVTSSSTSENDTRTKTKTKKKKISSWFSTKI